MDNKLLAALPRADFDALIRHGTVLPLSQGTVLCEAGDEASEVIFPLGGMISLVVVMRNGKAIETATVGREGVVGAMAGLGIHISQVRAVVQVAQTALKVNAAPFRRLTASSPAIANMCIRYNEVLLTQARVTAACNSLHNVEERFCRWLLQTSDRSGPDKITLTQEFLSEMLGVRRTSVTDVAKKVADAGMITYSRGVINILDRERLLAVSCECYETLRELAPP
ncbi:CRP-like cAMP-binding protein [Tardiphaga robiniae]|uniref:Crp/Fnr family transcriptional regulator n=1 Tax=Tardiphaga robiniae TaxID=943830 RepID=UPI00285DC304|nr:Crp/Fnr family transcriptional regulator [Tardiphaga robiniae]MDR6659075.1 CRP-like cAMP-binding protein [Tardiphaga robiniae]